MQNNNINIAVVESREEALNSEKQLYSTKVNEKEIELSNEYDFFNALTMEIKEHVKKRDIAELEIKPVYLNKSGFNMLVKPLLFYKTVLRFIDDIDLVEDVFDKYILSYRQDLANSSISKRMVHWYFHCNE